MDLPTTHADFLDLLFAHRNKAYGSYELRRQYPRRLKQALGLVFAACLLVTVAFWWNRQVPPETDPVAAAARPGIFNSRPIEIIPDKPRKIEAQSAGNSGPKTATVPNNNLTVTSDAQGTAPPDQDAFKNAVSGTTDQKGPAPDGPTGGTGEEAGAGTGRGKGAGDGDESEGARRGNQTPVLIADVMPAFDGDLDAYLSRQLRYPERAIQDGREGKVFIRFVVMEDGSIRDAEVIKGADADLNAEALRVVRAMPRWKPGRQGGQPVRVYFSIPVRFVLQG